MKFNLRFFIIILFVFKLSCLNSLFAQEPQNSEGFIVVLPAEVSEKFISKSNMGFHSFTIMGDQTVFIGGHVFMDQLKKENITFNPIPFKENESAWLLTTKDPNLKPEDFKNMRVVLRIFGFWVFLTDETTKMGMGAKMSDFSRIDPLPKNSTILTPTRKPSAEKKERDATELLLNRLDIKAYENDLKALVDVKTRYTYSPLSASALDFCEKIMREEGLQTRRISFKSSGATNENLEGIQMGFDPSHAGEVIVIGHLDSTSPQPMNLAPGADDNGSGAAGVLTLARFIKGLKGRATIRFVLTMGEEQGMLGSKAYVKGMKPEELARIRNVINLDMIGFDKQSPLSMVIETGSYNSQMAEQMTELAAKYTSLSTQISYHPWGSDHMPFINKEIPAVLTIESEFSDNPNYHKVTDTLEYINPEICLQILRLNAAALIEFASIERTP